MSPEDQKFLSELSGKIDRLLERLLTSTNQNLELVGRLHSYTRQSERVLEALYDIKQKLTEIWEQREFIRAGFNSLDTKLAVISKDVDDVERATREVREATGRHTLVENDPWYSRVLLKLVDAPARTQAFFVVLLGLTILVAVTGAAAKIVELFPSSNGATHHAP